MKGDALFPQKSVDFLFYLSSPPPRSSAPRHAPLVLGRFYSWIYNAMNAQPRNVFFAAGLDTFSLI